MAQMADGAVAPRRSVIFTCGYQRRPLEDVLEDLLASGVELVIDVRARAASRRPDFNKKRLSSGLSNAEIDYLHFPSLGVPSKMRKGDGGLEKALAWYSDRMKSDPPEDLAKLAQIVRKKTVALLCYEENASDCHRQILADLLADRVQSTIKHL